MLRTKAHHRFSIDDYERMIHTGILTENDRVELIHGEILDKMPIGDQHCACVKRLNKRLAALVGDRAILGVQDPIRLRDSEPEPDLVLLRPREDFYAGGKPRVEDVLLLIEVADTSLDFDRSVKRPLYAEAGIREFWIVNVVDRCVEVHRDPQIDGSYRDVAIASVGDILTVRSLSETSLPVAHLFA